MEMEKKKKIISNILLVLFIANPIGGFVLFFMGFYTMSFTVLGVFLFCAMLIRNWTGTKNVDSFMEGRPTLSHICI